jgi:hypothetical protein
LHGLVRWFGLPKNLGDQEFFVWGTIVLLSIPVLAVVAGASHRSWKVALLVFGAGGVLAYCGVEFLQ